MTKTERLHELVNRLPPGAVATAIDCLENLVSGDPVLHALDRTPADDEPDFDDLGGALTEARAEADRGETSSHDDVRRRLGLA